jgi:hypothetical protein
MRIAIRRHLSKVLNAIERRSLRESFGASSTRTSALRGQPVSGSTGPRKPCCSGGSRANLVLPATLVPLL